MREKILGLILFLFVICFVAIVVEETFLGGRQRRRREREARRKRQSQTEDGS